MKAFITGINGQDGNYLSRYLLELGYEVHGIIRRNSVPEHQESRIDNISNKIKTYYGDVTDVGCLNMLLKKIQPDEIYNLAAQSHVRISFDIPQYTAQVNALGALNVLEAYKENYPKAKYYQASSSEMFGNNVDSDNFQRLATPMKPISPYGISKLFAFNMTNMYRTSHGLHACNGILFNHESPMRGSNFVTTKVIKTAVQIKFGQKNELILGNLDAKRDWGHSKDYVVAMHKIINHNIPRNFIVATGQTRSIRELCDIVFSHFGLNYLDYTRTNIKYFRPNELEYLKGDSTIIQSVLGWKPKYTFESMIEEMIEHWYNILK